MKLNATVLVTALRAAEVLKADIEKMILGRELGAWQGSCGSSPAKATDVSVYLGKDGEYEDQIGLWYMWTVKMEDETGYAYNAGLCSFVPVPVLKDMFIQAFSGIGVPVSGRPAN